MNAQIHILGTGGGYGESIIINLGNDEWVIVDSCQDPKSKKCFPLLFLEEKEINPRQVKLIICTHWHDDHIRGISAILRICKEAKFSMAKVNDLKKILRMDSLDYSKLSSSVSKCSTKEFNACINIIKDRQSQIKYAIADKTLYTAKHKGLLLSVISLSPSDLSLDLFDREISTLIRDFGIPSKKMISQSINGKSVVLFLILGHHAVILGSDLEINENELLGWGNITSNSQSIKAHPKSSYIKIPHHGSKNGYSKSIWQILMKPQRIGTLSPWNKNEGLPNKAMLNMYRRITNELYITSKKSLINRPKTRDARSSKMISQFNSTVREIKCNYGLISSEIKTDDSLSWWVTTYSGTASKC